MQTSGSTKNGFLLEYQNGSLQEHYAASGPELPLNLVQKAFSSYFLDSSYWKTHFKWEKEAESQATNYRASKLLLMIALIAGIILWGMLRNS